MKKIFKMMALVAFMASAGIVSAADSDKAAAKSSTMKVPKPASSVGGAGYAEAVISMPVANDNQAPNGLTSNQSSGSFCGRAAVYTDTWNVTERTECQGHLIVFSQTTPEWHDYPSGANFKYQNPTGTGGYFLNKTSIMPDCPADYGLTVTGSSGPYQFYSCIKN